jgi:hypothetical protein
MPATEVQWSFQEQQIAKVAFERAHAREVEELLAFVRQQAAAINAVEDLWKLNDFLSARRHNLDGKYADCPNTLMFVLAELLRDGWLQLNDLEGLAKEKVTKISLLSRMG